MFDFEKFPVYQESEWFYLAVIKLLQKKKINRYIKDQLKRAALSITLNIAEGAGKYSKNDKKNYYIIKSEICRSSRYKKHKYALKNIIEYSNTIFYILSSILVI